MRNMAYKIKVTFAEGTTPDHLDQIFQHMGVTPNNPPEGGMTHEETVENGRIVFVEEWVSKEVFDTFLNQRAIPAHNALGIPLPEIEAL
jgi:hypothetical protein